MKGPEGNREPERGGPEHRGPERSEFWRRKRGKNLAILFALIVFMVLVYFIAIVRMQAGVDQRLEQEGEAQTGMVVPAPAPAGIAAAMLERG